MVEFSLESEVEELFKKKMQEFATFCATTWQMSKEDAKEFHHHKGEGYTEGYNCGLADGVQGALDFYLEEEYY